jgi:hypothetical protein
VSDAEIVQRFESAEALVRRLEAAPGWATHASNGWSARAVRALLPIGVLVSRDETAHLAIGETSFTQAETFARWLARWGYQMRRHSAHGEVYVLELGLVVPEPPRLPPAWML